MKYVRCINNLGYEASLTQGMVYKVLPDTDKTALRVIDNEGEDYLYESARFEPVVYRSTPESKENMTIRLDPLLKDILHAEALAAQKSISALVREWIDERLDLPVGA
jgi:hypothetical protein